MKYYLPSVSRVYRFLLNYDCMFLEAFDLLSRTYLLYSSSPVWHALSTDSLVRVSEYYILLKFGVYLSYFLSRESL